MFCLHLARVVNNCAADIVFVYPVFAPLTGNSLTGCRWSHICVSWENQNFPLHFSRFPKPSRLSLRPLPQQNDVMIRVHVMCV